MSRESYKVLDPNRKGVLKLPSGAVHVWFCIYMHQSEGQEAYLSIRGIAAATGLNKTTVNRWYNYLLETGWLVKTGGTAAERYSKPTPGAAQVPCVRVDDPTKTVRKSGTPTPSSDPSVPESGTVRKSGTVPENGTKVCESEFERQFGWQPAMVPSRQQAGQHLIQRPAGAQTPNPKPKNKNQKPPASASALGHKRKVAADGTEFPVGFFGWSNAERLFWLESHGGTYKPGLGVDAGVGFPPVPDKLSPAPVASVDLAHAQLVPEEPPRCAHPPVSKPLPVSTRLAESLAREFGDLPELD